MGPLKREAGRAMRLTVMQRWLPVFSSLLGFLVLIPVDSFAHHGKEFLVASTCKTPPKGSFFALLSSEYVRSGHHSGRFEFEPGVLYGMTNWWSVELHSHNGLSEGDFHVESIALETRFRFLGSGDVHVHDDKEAFHHEASSPFSLAALLEYEKGLRGLHDAFEGRFIVGRDFRPISLVANIIFQKNSDEEGRRFKFRYAVGVKNSFNETIGMGIELDGGTQHETGVRLTPGIYTTLTKDLDLRVGVSFGLGDTGDEGLSLRGTLLYEF